MNSHDTTNIAADELLDRHIEAARQQFDAAGIEQAARRVRAQLARSRSGTRRLSRWPSFVSAASVLLVAIALLTFFTPGDDGTAFAQAQQWLASFHTLRAETTVDAGDVVSTVTAWLDESGDTRIESFDTTTIIKPETGMIYVLQPDGQTFARPIAPESVVSNATEFLENIRAFRGQADPLAEARVIDGISAMGYRLEGATSTDVLWIDPADGRPLLVESQLPGGVTMHTVLTFDVPLPANAFDVPDENSEPEPID